MKIRHKYLVIEDLSERNLQFIHKIFPGREGMYWVDFNWYWDGVIKRRDGLKAKLYFDEKRSKVLAFSVYGKHFKDRFLKENDDGRFELYHLVVDDKLQGHKLGKYLTVLALKEMASNSEFEEAVVACHPDNRLATKMYLGLGFKEFSKNYDDDPLYKLSKEQVEELSFPSIADEFEVEDSYDLFWEKESLAEEMEFSWEDWEKGIVD